MKTTTMHRLRYTALIACVCLVSTDGAISHRQALRSTLIRANPALSGHKRAHMIRETFTINPLQATLRSLKFWRYAGPIVIHYKLTEHWCRIAHGNNPVQRAKIWEALHTKHAPTGLKLILELQGLFVKIGQVMSSRADFIPRQYVDAFTTLQDQAPTRDKDQIETIINDSLRGCQQVNIHDVFESIGEVLGSASIGQVHKAKLTAKYGGRTVAVKIMHPNAEDLFRNDLKVFRTLCTVALPGWEPILREFETQIMTEFDYGNEANNLQLVRANVARSPYANKVRVPEPMINLCSKNLLVMEYLSGKKMATAIEDRLAAILGGDVQMARKVLQAKQRAVFESRDAGTKAKGYLHELSDIIGENDDGLSMRQRTTKALELMLMVRSARRTLSLLLDATGHQIFNDGLYNGDPHPGNILVLDCGRLGLIDYGQTRSLSRDDRLALAKVVAALGKQCTSAREVSDAMRKFGFLSRDANEENMAHFGELYFDSDERGRTLGHATPQKYLMHLNANDPMLVIPDPAVFVARTSFLYRGLGSLLQQHLRTSHHWRKHALLALATEGEGRSLYNLGLTPPR